MTELVMCRRGPERQAGAARPDLGMLPFCHLRSRRSDPGRARHLEGLQRRYLPGCRPAWAEATLFNPSTLTPTRYRWRPSPASPHEVDACGHAPIGQPAVGNTAAKAIADEYLCISCLGRRLGRRLTSASFPAIPPTNLGPEVSHYA
jgi:hypothetical protein